MKWWTLLGFAWCGAWAMVTAWRWAHADAPGALATAGLAGLGALFLLWTWRQPKRFDEERWDEGWRGNH